MKNNIDSVKQFWNRNLNGLKFLSSFPKEEEDFWKTSNLRYKYHYHLPPLFDRVATKFPNGKMLEIGCGMGDDTAQWVKRGMNVTAIDLTEAAVECTKKRLAACNLSAIVRTGNAESVEFPENSFDVVYSFGVLHHSPDTPKTIDEVHRILKPGGLAIIMLYNRKSLNYLIHRILHYPFDGTKNDPCPVEHTYTQNEVLNMFGKFSHCHINLDYLFGTGYGIFNAICPNKIHRILGKQIGWHIMIEATK